MFQNQNISCSFRIGKKTWTEWYMYKCGMVQWSIKKYIIRCITFRLTSYTIWFKVGPTEYYHNMQSNLARPGGAPAFYTKYNKVKKHIKIKNVHNCLNGQIFVWNLRFVVLVVTMNLEDIFSDRGNNKLWQALTKLLEWSRLSDWSHCDKHISFYKRLTP